MKPATGLHWPAVTIIAAATLCIGVLVGMLTLGPGQERFDFLYDTFTISDCLDDPRLGPGPDSPVSNPQVVTCYNVLRLQGQLNEFLIRRVNFQNQHVADVVIMWMVVVLTLAGVGLAAYQIIATVKFAPSDSGAQPAPTELRIEEGKLFVRSSVTGLFILIVSFGFFYTYVIYVYTVTDIGETLERIEARPAEAPADPTEAQPVQAPEGSIFIPNVAQPEEAQPDEPTTGD